MKLTNRKIFTITLAVTAIHFVLTSAMGYYIAVHQGKEMGKIVTEGLAKILEARQKVTPQKAKEVAKRISQDQDMEKKIKELIRRWEIPTILISLPLKHFMKPLLQDLQEERMKKVLSKEISLEQFYTQARIMSLAANLVNSFAFGLLIYAIIIIFNRKPRYDKQRNRIKNKPSKKAGSGLD